VRRPTQCHRRRPTQCQRFAEDLAVAFMRMALEIKERCVSTCKLQNVTKIKEVAVGRVDGKVAFITGVARGQGRSHAIRLAEEGADIIGVDLCAEVETVDYALATMGDLKETVRLVEAAGGRIVASRVDIRDLAGLKTAVRDGVEELGRLDIVVANACTINGYGATWELTEAQWHDQIDIGLTGTWKTICAVVPFMLEQDEGGSIILISSTSGLSAEINVGHYVAAKHGVTGLMRALASELAPHMIRVNSVHPANVRTPMTDNTMTAELFAGGRLGAQFDDPDVIRAAMELSALPVPYAEAIDISHAVMYLASDEGRYVTGSTHVVDLGRLMITKIPHPA
jgi:SDR family mycofactocin-dependent oxidoreductase